MNNNIGHGLVISTTMVLLYLLRLDCWLYALMMVSVPVAILTWQFRKTDEEKRELELRKLRKEIDKITYEVELIKKKLMRK